LLQKQAGFARKTCFGADKVRAAQNLSGFTFSLLYQALTLLIYSHAQCFPQHCARQMGTTAI
jgi:hypothetical protein